MEKKGYLLLADGQLFEGVRFGADKDVYAELVFTTAMTGYLETITDPSYTGQIVIQTFPSIGNYGVIPEDFESKRPGLSAYIVRECCDTPSNFRSQGTLSDYLKEQGIPGLCGVDTRQLTRRIRSAGVMNAALLMEKPEDMDAILAKLRALPFHPCVQDVSCKSVQEGQTEGKYHVVMWDFGAKDSIQHCLEERGCHVTRVPADTTADEILALKPDGVMLSNGPGDPADNTRIIEQLALLETHKIPTFGICLGHQLLALSQGAKARKLKYGHRGENQPRIIEQLALLETHKIPTFGICLGHQLLALSQGAKARKLKYGHRGENQPAKDLVTGLSYMTSQNHGFAVDAETLPPHAVLRFVNGNDGTCEGLDYQGMPAFSVQFHPEACGGPLDTLFLFDRFIQMMGGNHECR